MNQTDMWVVDSFLFLYVVMVARSREIRWYQATLISMFGFLLAGTPFAYPVWFMVQEIGGIFFS
ncbi:hypothetical protein OG223_27595 [Streptomyces sp. NBC_01478]|uniref:hypothetical protein n=1 Tax=Streptomyces sp. NBC_01478 TaxID=2903882 RepID=UPI002E2FE5E3|nr:hypothetical protein [Streptomyces sp. NBC_01478]